MVLDSELVARLQEILRSSDLNTTTPGTVRRQLEKDFGVDLSERKRFVSQQIDEFLDYHAKNEEGDEDGITDVDEVGINGTASVDEVESGEVEEEEEVANDGEGEGEGVKVVNKKRSRKKLSSDEASPKKNKGGGFRKVCSLSPRLEELFGTSELARTEVVKRLWIYIRENNLQDPSNKKIIRCDEKLRAIFNVDRIDMFQMNKALSKHIWPLEADDEDEQTTKPKKKGNSGLTAPIPLSEELINFLGTGETQLSRSEVIKRMWDYFKKNELQDPTDKRRILCDDKLKGLFDVDCFLGFSIAKLLSSHFIKPER
ncbi:hypothetical protein V2J09_021250 [Rumex salicifolius]